MQYFDYIKQLHDLELYQDLKQLACIVMTLCDSSAETEDLTSDVEVKYKIYECLLYSKQYKEAMSVLEGISTKQRTAKVNLALAKLYIRSGMDRSAITSYKEVLRLSQWIRGHAQVSSNDYVNAVRTFRLDLTDCLKDNVYMVTSIARALFLDGHYKQALTAFQRAHAIDPLHLANMDIYAYLLYKERRGLVLQRLANQLMSATETSPEPWVAMGYLALYTKKNSRAVYYAQKANTLDGMNVEGLLLKATAFLELYGAMIAKEPTAVAKAKPYLEKAMKLDPSNLLPVYVMADILKQEKKFDNGVDLLDPTNELARQGIEQVENGESGAENTFDVEMEHSVSEADFDGSDVESTWSDDLG
ncbi:APC7-like protein [Mya arenaria]|uniref:APC7-like protein n=1 Tax=Mya arenaria TaxID=6604 RepID=A0ABY7E4B6_MYAAR|nr:APC7-like protein [Mya arenaria]